ncbi:hypothetical protein SNE40_012762 [Patella caerulea]|uniref:Uncharacterized protein n=1 Tax=Patella caerulea TaxID=87958 RepID=A0AAN8JKW1_PATCE
MNSAVVLLVVAFAAVALGSFETRQVAPKAKICGQVNDRCGMTNGMQCCKGYSCQSYGLSGQRRCQLGGGSVGGCINRGNTCSITGNGRRCCMGSQCKRISGRSVCM